MTIFLYIKIYIYQHISFCFLDRTRSHEFLNELNDGMAKIESYIKCLKRETVDRAQLIDALEVATSYYEEQSGEVKTVAEV